MRAAALASVLALAACAAPGAGVGPAPLDLYYGNLSLVRADGARVLYSRDGLACVETISGNRGDILLLRRRLFHVSEERRAALNAFLDAFPRKLKPVAGPGGAGGPGGPGSVRDRFVVGRAAFELWRSDVGTQPPPIPALMEQLSALIAASEGQPSTTLELSGPLPWPPQFAHDRRAE